MALAVPERMGQGHVYAPYTKPQAYVSKAALQRQSDIGGSSNGRTTDSDSVYRGSSPRPPAKFHFQPFWAFRQSQTASPWRLFQQSNQKVVLGLA